MNKSHRKRWSQEPNDIITTPKRHERFHCLENNAELFPAICQFTFNQCWTQSFQSAETQNVAVAKQMQPSPRYDEYLLLLQQRNKMLEKVKLTNKEQLEKEKKEKGFTLYVNGANDGKGTRRKTPHPHSSPRVTTNSRLAAELNNISNNAGEDLSLQIPSPSSRSRSAPEKAQKTSRKNWNASSINIQTARGDKMHLHAPDVVTGNYEEDFEDLTVTESISTNNKGQQYNSDSDDADSIRDSVHCKNEKTSRDNTLTESISDHVLLSVNDVSKLRKSLELSRFVRESICQDTDEDDDSEVEEEIADVTSDNVLSAADTIVLEFAPSKQPAIRSSHLPRRSASSQSHIQHKMKHQTNTNKQKPTPKNIELKPSQPKVKTPRPLSSVKRASGNSKTESAEERSQVLSALADENMQIGEYRARNKDISAKASLGNPLINSFMLNTEDDMKDVEDRVLQMEPRQQRNLIKTLYQLEKTVRPSSTAVTTRDDRHSRSKNKDTEVHKIMLEFMSNWGAKSQVGLTEVQLLDECNQRLNINTSFLRLDGAKNCIGDVSNLFNNRYRTVKERNMFCCEKSGQRPVSLSFRVEIPLGSQINKIKFWNYNKSLTELNVGVKRLRISIDDDIIYDGDLEKGCGNQVFDYGHTIVVGSDGQDSDDDQTESLANTQQPPSNNNHTSYAQKDSSQISTKESHQTGNIPSQSKRLHHPDHNSVRKSDSSRKSSEMWIPLSDTPEPMERSKTRVLVRSTDGLEVPTVYSSDSDQDVETYNGTEATYNTSNTGGSLAGSQLSIKPPLPHSQLNDASKARGVTKPVRNSTQSKLPWMDKNMDPASSIAHRSPSPSANNTNNKEGKGKAASRPDWLEKSKDDPLRSSLDEMLEALDKWEPGDKRNQENLKTIFDETLSEPQVSDGIPTKVASEAEEANYRKNASKEMTRAERRRANHKKMAAETRRKKWQQPSVDLEASWTSLDMFARSHKGRLSMEGDALDEYMRTVGTPGTGITVDGSTQPTNDQPSTDVPLQAIAEEEPFIIPELPCGESMVINIKSTWGDKYYVGLNGIELFADTGEPISIAKVTANPRDINVLPDYKNDPRVVGNLTDGVNKTRDDIHMWLAPFTDGSNHFITLTFAQPSRLALLRIWNYNKSRIHSYRGAKDVEIQLDGSYIFKGEIARACGGTQGGTEAFGDTILFTMSDEILDAVSRHDGQYEGGNFSDEWEDDVPYDARPSTADKGDSDRPFTSVLSKPQKKGTSVHHSINTPLLQPEVTESQSGSMAAPVSVDGTTLVYRAKKISLNFTETWGDPHYLGLTGMEIVAKDGEAIPITMDMLHADPQDLHVLPGYETDDRTLDKVIDGVNITGSDEHMWLIPYTEGADHTLTVTFPRPQELVGLRFWNYNKSAEDTYRGAKTVHVLLDNLPVSPSQGFLIRKGPGNCFYDFAQELLFSDILRRVQLESQLNMPNSCHDTSGDDSEDYVISGNMPKGFVYQFHLMSAQSDLYYLGLNAIEFYDCEGRKIELDENNVAAYPESVNVLDGIEGDIRTPDKLIIDVNERTNTDHNMWLSPMLPGITNRLFVIFDYPQMVSMIKIWNYSKTPNRGVKEFALLVDDLLVYNGVFGPVTYGRGILPNTVGPQNFHTVLFTNDEKIKNKVKHTIVSNQTEELDVQLTNDNLVMSKPVQSKLHKTADQTLRPKTGVQRRPTGKRW